MKQRDSPFLKPPLTRVEGLADPYESRRLSGIIVAGLSVYQARCHSRDSVENPSWSRQGGGKTTKASATPASVSASCPTREWYYGAHLSASRRTPRAEMSPSGDAGNRDEDELHRFGYSPCHGRSPDRKPSLRLGGAGQHCLRSSCNSGAGSSQFGRGTRASLRPTGIRQFLGTHFVQSKASPLPK